MTADQLIREEYILSGNPLGAEYLEYWIWMVKGQSFYCKISDEGNPQQWDAPFFFGCKISLQLFPYGHPFVEDNILIRVIYVLRIWFCSIIFKIMCKKQIAKDILFDQI